MIAGSLKSLLWVGTTRKNLTAFPDDVKGAMGSALYLERYPTKLDQFDGGKSVVRAGAA